MTMTESYIGVDIAKDWIDAAEDGGARRRVKATPRLLLKFARACAGRLVVFEASGGYERPFVRALEEVGVAYARVNPRHAREFARATGLLAKTDRVDAALLARMGAALNLEPAAPRDPAAEPLHPGPREGGALSLNCLISISVPLLLRGIVFTSRSNAPHPDASDLRTIGQPP